MKLIAEFKETVWVKVEVENATESLIESIKRGDITSASDLCDVAEEHISVESDDVSHTTTYLIETSTPLDISDNEGFSTIELFDEDDKLIWENGNNNRKEQQQ